MKTIVYTSRVADCVVNEGELLSQIITKAKDTNSGLSISGAMILMNHRFLQVLEGPSENVETLAAKIARDSRHTDFQILFEQPIDQRSFSNWSMMGLQVAQPGSFNSETLVALKRLYDRNFTFRADSFIELLQETLSDPELMQSML